MNRATPLSPAGTLAQTTLEPNVPRTGFHLAEAVAARSSQFWTTG